MTHGRAAATLRAHVTEREPIGLPEVLSAAALQTRVDRKYLLTAEQFTAFADRLHGGFRALDIAGRRLHAYESVYFDTPALDCYRQHRQGRRRRYKIRTRAYTDTGERLVEVKLEGPRDSTDKRRLPCPQTTEAGAADELSPRSRRFVTGVLAEYDVPVPPRLERSLVTGYRRATLVDPAGGARLTLDVGLEFTHDGWLRRGPDRLLVESKSPGSSAADAVLADLGVRPVSLSKYCVGLALTRPGLPANRWSRLLRHEFGWFRTVPA